MFQVGDTVEVRGTTTGVWDGVVGDITVIRGSGNIYIRVAGYPHEVGPFTRHEIKHSQQRLELDDATDN